MQRIPTTVIVLLTIGIAPLSADEGSGKDVLLQAREAIKHAKVVRYEAQYAATGYIKQWVKDVKGKVLVGEHAEYDVPRFFVQVDMPGDDDSPTHVTAGCDGNEYFLVDQASKTVYADLDPAVLGSNSRTLQRLLLKEFGDDNPFADELESDRVILDEAESVAGEDCAVVRIKSKNPPDTMWWISKKDHLPRRVRHVYTDDKEGEGTTELTLSALVVNPPVKERPFRVRVPTGFKKTDDFAP